MGAMIFTCFAFINYSPLANTHNVKANNGELKKKSTFGLDETSEPKDFLVYIHPKLAVIACKLF